MSEALQKTHEVSRRPAAEVFAPAEQLEADVDAALDNGDIEIDIRGLDTDNFAPADISLAQQIEETDILSRKPNSSMPKDIELKPESKPKIEAAIKDRIEDEVHRRLLYDGAKYLYSPQAMEAIAEDDITEAFNIVIAGREIPLLNMSETALSEEQVESIRGAFANLVAKGSPDTMDGVSMLMIQKRQRFISDNDRQKAAAEQNRTVSDDEINPDTVGSMNAVSGVLLLSEALIDGSVAYQKFDDVDADPLGMTVTHELGHFVQLNAQSNRMRGFTEYADAVGWKTKNIRTIDDYGVLVKGQKEQLERPAIEYDGGYGETVSNLGKFGIQAIMEAKPPTEYAHTNDLEDFAESTVLYAYASDLLDPIRHDAIDRYFETTRRETAGPYDVTVERANVAELSFGHIEPRPFTVNLSYWWNTSNFANAVSSGVPQPNIDPYNSHPTLIVDDFGNQVVGKARKPS